MVAANTNLLPPHEVFVTFGDGRNPTQRPEGGARNGVIVTALAGLWGP